MTGEQKTLIGVLLVALAFFSVIVAGVTLYDMARYSQGCTQ